MAELSGTVGENGVNRAHDVRLVEVMLRVAKDRKGNTYARENADGKYTIALRNAIVALQTDHELLAAKPGAGRPPEKAGLIAPASESWARLVAGLPDDRRRLRTATEIGVAYLAMDEAALRHSLATIQNPLNNLEQTFKGKIGQLVQELYKDTGIVASIIGPGLWRTFDAQVGLVSDGGPGETIHNYGLAVDMGFAGLQWVDGAGKVHPPTRGNLEDTALKYKQRMDFWNARNKIAHEKLALFPTTKGGDLAHIQAFEDAPVDSAGSLAELLEAVGPRKMKWETFEMTPTSYKCDLGLGGARYLVGTALDLWVLDPSKHPAGYKLREKGITPQLRLTKVELAGALSAKLKADPKFSIDGYLGRKAQGSAAPTVMTAADLTDADMLAVRRMLKGEFEAAAKHWKQWKRIYYPQRGARRATHQE